MSLDPNLLKVAGSMLQRLRWAAVVMVYCVCLISVLPANAGEAEDRRVRISLEIFPRIVAVDLDLRSKVSKHGTLRLFVLFENDVEGARHIAAQMKNSFTNIGGLAVEFVVRNAQQVGEEGIEHAAGVFLSEVLSEATFPAVMKTAVAQRVLVFSPFAGDVERGATVGIAISSRIKPYFNVATLAQSQLNINEKLLSISQRYE